MHFLEWYYCDSDVGLVANSLTIHYMQYPPNCLFQNQFGFLQEIRYAIPKDILNSDTNQSLIPPNLFYNTLSYCPYNINCYELGIFYFPIILNPYLFNSLYYSYPLQLYIFYMSYEVCNQPIYYINVPYIHICNKTNNELTFTIVYRCPVNYSQTPICYTWQIHKILVNLSTNNCHHILKIYKNVLNDIAQQIFTTLNNKTTQELVAPALLCHFYQNYQYKFGFNYGLNGMFPSNNGYVSCQLYNQSMNNIVVNYNCDSDKCCDDKPN